MILNPHLEGDPFFWPGNSTGILLLHGFSATTAEVRPLAQALHQHGYTVAGPLLPGHKTTLDDMDTCRWQDWVSAAEGAYERLQTKCERVFLGGESMGGILSLLLANRHPEAAGILAYAPVIRLPLARTLIIRLTSPFVRHYTPPRRPLTIVDDRWQGYAARPARALRQLFALMAEVDRRLPAVTQPILIAQGQLDRTVDVRGAQRLYERIGSRVKELHWLACSTHCVILDEELPQVVTLTLNFIKSINPPH
ncbi:MAG TPA: alpha/beta fold hydrolase [Anaerolineales bacterium]|nr:alpha/beta fold hydrolase [Anaerolineales bacterium]